MREMKDSGVEWIGNVPKEWITIKLKYLFGYGDDNLKIGPFGSAMKGKTLENGPYKIYNQAHLIQNDFSINRHFVSEDTFLNLQSYEVKPGDILFSMMGTIGKCQIMPSGFPKGIMDSHLLKAKVNEKIIPQFLCYAYDKDYSDQVYFQLLYASNGTIMNGLNSSILKNCFIALPAIEEQKKIIHYLDSKCFLIDSIISKQEAIIEKLKEYKLSVITEAVTKGLNPNVEMKDSGVEWIGKVPNNFRVSTFKRFCFVNQGLQIAQSDRMTEPGENRYVYITVKFLNETDKEHSIEYIENPPKSTICCRDDILMARTGATGLVITGVDGCFHNNFFRINYNRQMLIHDYLVFYLMQDSIKQYLLLMAGTTTIPDLNHGDFYSTPLIVPPLEDQIEIVTYLKDKIDKIDKMIQKRQILITKLREYKKDLIYEVVTGKKEV